MSTIRVNNIQFNADGNTIISAVNTNNIVITVDGTEKLKVAKEGVNFRGPISVNNTPIFGGSGEFTATINLINQVSNVLNVASGGTGLTSPGTSGNVLVSNGTSWVSQAQPNRYNAVVISSNTNASVGTYYVATAVLTLTLPGSPVVGDYVGFTNPTVNTTSVIARNTANISGLAEDLTVDKANTSLVLMYSGVNKGWVFV